MSDKLGWFQFYPRDWYSDPDLAVASPLTRGIWIDLLCAMFIKGEDSITGDRWSLARVARADPEEIDEFINHAKCYKFCDVTECNGEVTVYTIVSRRFRRESKERANIRERVKRHRSKNDGNESVTPNDPKCTSVYVSDSVSNSVSKSGSDSDQFDEFYAQYPRHVAKESARKAWGKLTPSERSLALLDVSRRKAGEWSNKEPQYVPHPATYLNGRRWTDEAAPAARAGPRLSEGRKGLWDNIERLERANGTNGSTQNTVESIGHLEPPIDRRSGAG